jgi:enoyl-CoA hydratase/carnithine racemase
MALAEARVIRIDDYKNRFKYVRIERTDGILEVTIHRDGGSAVWEASERGIHCELGEAFYFIGRDIETKVMIFTGAGNAFIEKMDVSAGLAAMTSDFWFRMYKEGKDLLMNLLDIEAPIIGAVNGNAFIHAELIALSDIVIAAEGARFADKAHAVNAVPPSDGVHVVWPMLLGPNRARHFLMTGAEIDAAEALRLGIVAEVVPKADVLNRARAVARELAQKPSLMLRYSRAALTQNIKRRLLDDLGYGLALEGLGIQSLADRR